MYASSKKPERDESRANAGFIGNRAAGAGLAEIVDNRNLSPAYSSVGIIQREKKNPVAGGMGPGRVIQLQFDAGEGARWHIHHDHIKLGNNANSRVNFNGRTRQEIRRELGDKINRYGLNVGGDLAASFRECIEYINANF